MGPADLGLPRQEHQHRARIRPQRPQGHLGDRILDPPVRVALGVAGLHREGPALGGYDRGIAQQPRDPGAVQGRRHDQDAQILAQPALRIARDGQAQIGVEGALVEFVEQDRPDAGKLRIFEDHAREHTLGDHLDPGPRRDL